MAKPFIEAEYRGQTGLIRVPETTLRALSALFEDAEGGDDALHPIILRSADGPSVIPLPERWAGRGASHWRISPEQGGQYDGALSSSEIVIADGLPHGYHRLQLLADGQPLAETVLVIAPASAFLPEALREGGRIWGIALQLYALRSARNWGIGDFTDLVDLIPRAAAAGASLIGLNPLHALFPADPERASPYSPSSRDFLNTLYIDPETVADFAECEPARRLCQSPEFAEKLDALRNAPLIDYSGVAAQKHAILHLLHRSFRSLHLAREDDPRALEFRAFQRRRGAALRLFALFHALQETLSENGEIRGWPQWPEALRDPHSPEVEEFARSNEVRVEFHEYLQWQAALQLEACAARARNAQMPVGLYLDIAIGADSSSASTWTNPPYWVRGWSIGAPPDDWNATGQNWGLPPPHPLVMRKDAYAGFRAMLRANMEQAGAIRLDHVLGLMRLFFIPHGAAPPDGAYVHYPLEELLSILALESERNRCLVVGEDLGTVPEGLSETLNGAGLLSYRLLYFERDADGRFRPPEAWARCAIAAVTTHDLPTLAGYWAGADIALKADLRLIPDKDAVQLAIEERETSKRALLEAVSLPDWTSADPPIDGVHRFLARTRSMIAMIHLEDLLNVRDQVNMPGTTVEHPNWRRKLPLDLPAIFADPTVRRVFSATDAARRSAPSRTLSEPLEDALRLPTALYRLQFNAGFTFRDATALIPYFHALGISHLYASPYLKARPGSTHGYDISDHNALNPEIGTPAELDAFCDALRRHGMGHVLDFIPNHMGVGRSDNSLWLDVLEWGQDSPFANFFDINWNARQEALRGRILLPVLGGHYGTVLEQGEIVLRFDAATGTLSFWYHEHCCPLHPGSYAAVLSSILDGQYASVLSPAARRRLGATLAGFVRLTQAPTREAAHALRQELSRLCDDAPDVLPLIEHAVGRYAGKPGNPESFIPLHRLLERQPYRLAYWRVAADEINFRRFFDINELAGLRMEQPEVFVHTHRLIGRLIAEGKLHGLRLDHLDGLYDPAAYLESLQTFAAEQQGRARDPHDPFFVVVEKILAPHEALREDWPVAGTTGYDFIALANGLQIDSRGERALDRSFRRRQARKQSLEEILYDCRGLVIETLLASELNALASDLDRLSEQHWSTRDYSWERLRAALREVAANFPVYRSYIGAEGVREEDRRYIDWAVAKARKTYTGADPEIFDFVQAALTTDLVAEPGPYRPQDALRFAMRFQQFTGPVAAKSLEDTAFYRYMRLLSLNEVGSDPARFGTSPQAFHHAMQQRTRRWPHAVNALSTHDTKRGEDARARLNVLSELAEEWDERVRRWFTLNRFRRHALADHTAPLPADEYLIYQMLFGAWPVDWGPGVSIAEPLLDIFRGRMRQAIRKSLREAKSVTSWYNPNTEYETACLDFADKILDAGKPNPFLDDFRSFVARAVPIGVLNSLSQTVLKLTAPGIPDLYQGTELWDFSLVDPDNRRPVAYQDRIEALAQLIGATERRATATRREDFRRMLAEWHDGRIKLAVTATLLRLRRDHRALFLNGSYEPVEIEGEKKDHALAFLRRQGHEICLVVTGRLYASLGAWAGTTLAIPDVEHLTCVFTGRALHATNGWSLAALLEDLPVGVFLVNAQNTPKIQAARSPITASARPKPSM